MHPWLEPQFLSMEMDLWSEEWALDTAHPKEALGILVSRTSHVPGQPLLSLVQFWLPLVSTSENFSYLGSQRLQPGGSVITQDRYALLFAGCDPEGGK